MKNITDKTKEQLLKEIKLLKNRVSELEKYKIKYKEEEEKLHLREEKWRSLIENSPDHVMLLDLDYTIQFINHTVPDWICNKNMND